MVPVDALSRYSIADGENGPPGGPEKATLVDGATTNVVATARSTFVRQQAVATAASPVCQAKRSRLAGLSP